MNTDLNERLNQYQRNYYDSKKKKKKKKMICFCGIKIQIQTNSNTVMMALNILLAIT